MIKDYNFYRKLATALNSSFGTSGPGGAGLTFESVKFSILDDDTLKATYVSQVTFNNTDNVQNLIKKFENEALNKIQNALKDAKKNFKELELAREDGEKKSVSFKIDTKKSIKDIEYLNVHSAVKRAFFKYTCMIEVS